MDHCSTELDAAPFRAAVSELQGLLAIAPQEAGEAFRVNFLGLQDAQSGLSKLVSFVCSAEGTRHRHLRLEPSNLMERVLAAVRAGDWKWVNDNQAITSMLQGIHHAE